MFDLGAEYINDDGDAIFISRIWYSGSKICKNGTDCFGLEVSKTEVRLRNIVRSCLNVVACDGLVITEPESKWLCDMLPKIHACLKKEKQSKYRNLMKFNSM